jgi:hypothetical protein
MERQSQLPPDGQLDLFPPDVLCEYEHCRKVVPQPFYVVKHFGRMTSQLPFCNETCANEFYLNRLRESGV